MKKELTTYNLQLTISPGFTLIELMVVVSVMVILAGIFVLNIGGQRSARNIKIAQNQLVSDIRKVQSYTLSARALPSGQSAQYYLIKFDLLKPAQYTVQAISNAGSAPQLQDIETINLPPNIQLAAVSPITISRSLAPTSQSILSSPACALAAFAAPFGKIIFNDGCSPIDSSASPLALSLSDDYYANIINFQTNVSCPSYPPPASLSICRASVDSIMTITLTDNAKTLSKTVTINGITGAVIFN